MTSVDGGVPAVGPQLKAVTFIGLPVAHHLGMLSAPRKLAEVQNLTVPPENRLCKVFWTSSLEKTWSRVHLKTDF